MNQQDKVKAEKAEKVFAEFKQLSSDRYNEETHWTEIAERIYPEDARVFLAADTERTRGEKRNSEVYDSTASVALERFTAIVDSLLSPRNQTYHRLGPSDPYLLKDRATKEYFEEANRVLFKYRYAPKANFSGQNQQVYTSMGAYGTGALFIDKLAGSREKGLRYKHAHLSGVYFAENHQGIIDKAFRRYSWTARQAIQKFGPDNLPPAIIKKAAEKPETLFWFLHCVKPREDYDPERADFKGMPLESEYLCFEEKRLLTEGSYNTFPYAISRYTQAVDEVYGRSVAMKILPAVKTLNEQKKTVLKQGHRAVDPVLLAHDDGVMDSFSMKPGAVNFGGVSADGRPLVHTLPVGNIAVGKDMMDDERAVINDAFLVTLFQILVENPQMTATEVIERTREKGILLAPTIGRQQDEYQGPQIERELDVLAQQRLLPPMPPALLEAEGEYKVIFDSPMARAQRSEESAGVVRTIETALSVAVQAQDPSILDHFNFDEIIPELASIQGVPTKWMNGPKQLQAIREGRQQQQSIQTAMQAAPGVAAVTKAGAMVNGKK